MTELNFIIKIILIFVSFNLFANDIQNNKIVFKINKKVFTNIDLNNRIQYIKFTNNLDFNEIIDENFKKEILDDYISALIFYEYQ